MSIVSTFILQFDLDTLFMNKVGECYLPSIVRRQYFRIIFQWKKYALYSIKYGRLGRIIGNVFLGLHPSLLAENRPLESLMVLVPGRWPHWSVRWSGLVVLDPAWHQRQCGHFPGEDEAWTRCFKNYNIWKIGTTTLSLTTLSITTFSITTLSIMTFSRTTLSIMTFSIMTFSIMAKHCYAECHICRVSHILSVTYAECHLCWVPHVSLIFWVSFC